MTVHSMVIASSEQGVFTQPRRGAHTTQMSYCVAKQLLRVMTVIIHQLYCLKLIIYKNIFSRGVFVVRVSGCSLDRSNFPILYHCVSYVQRKSFVGDNCSLEVRSLDTGTTV